MSDKAVRDEWDIPRFERWVRVGVEAYVLEDAGPTAFPEAAHLILNTGSLTLGLKAFADGLNAFRRDNLKQAIAQVLSSLEPSAHYAPVAEQLLVIAVAVTAYPILAILAPKIGEGFFGQSDAEARGSLFAMTLYSVARLAAPGRQDALRCIGELIASSNFKPAHASTALIAACQVDRRRLAEHLAIPGLRQKLKAQFETYDPDGRVRRQVALDILAITGIENFTNALSDLRALDPSIGGAGPDDWLTEALMFSPDSPAQIQVDITNLTAAVRTTPDIAIPITLQSSRLSVSSVRPLGLADRIPGRELADASVDETWRTIQDNLVGMQFNTGRRDYSAGRILQ